MSPLEDTSKWSTALARGWCRKCPRCGQGRMFQGYLSIAEQCSACALPFEPLRADDAPAYFTIFAVGHIVVPLVLVVERWGHEPPLWFHALLWLPLSVILALYLLPHIKGAVIALLWTHRISAHSPSSPGGLDNSP